MSELEDLLTRTLRDPGRALPAPVDPVPAIRARARRQRRTELLAAAAVLLVAAAALLLPAAVRQPAPVATEPPAGLLPWPARGALAGDRELVDGAARAWPGAKRPVYVLWAERLGGDLGDRVVLLQGFGRDGRPRLAEVAELDGRLQLVRSDPLPDLGVAALRLVEPWSPSRAATVMLVAPGAATVVVPPAAGAADRDPRLQPPRPSGLLTVPAELGGRPVALLDQDGGIVGSGEVPPRDTLTVARGQVRLAAPRRRTPAGTLTPEPSYWSDGRLFANRLNGTLGDDAPTEVAVLDDSTGWDVAGGPARVRVYELRRSGRTYLASAVWLAGRPYCVRLDDVAVQRPSPDALVVRCWLPQLERGLVFVTPVEGIKVTGVRVDAAGPEQQPVREAWSSPVDRYLAAFGPNLPTGPGEVRLVDDGGLARPPVSLPPYRP